MSWQTKQADVLLLTGAGDAFNKDFSRGRAAKVCTTDQLLVSIIVDFVDAPGSWGVLAVECVPLRMLHHADCGRCEAPQRHNDQ